MDNVLIRCVLISFIVLLTLNRPALAAAPDVYEKAFEQFKQQEYKQAYILLKTALDDEPGHLPSKLLMGKVLLLEGLIVDAEKEFEEALLMGADPNIVVPDLLQAYLLTAQYEKITSYDARSLTRETRADVALFKANAYDNLGSSDTAETYFKEALSLSSEQRFLNSFAAFLLRAKREEEARDWISKAYSQSPTDTRTLHLKGMQSTLQGDYQTALEWYLKAHQLNDTDPVVNRSLVFAYLKLGNHEKAEQLVNDILLKSENDPIMLLAKASIKTSLGKDSAAAELIESLSNKLTTYQENAGASGALLPLIRGVTYFLSRQYQNSANQLEQYVSLSTPDKNATHLLAHVYIQLDEKRKAQRLLEQNLSLTTQDSRLTNLLCSIYIESNRAYFCENLLDQVSPSVKQTVAIQLLRIRLLREQGKYPAAIQYLVTTFTPPIPLSAKVALTQLYVQNNETDKALGVLDELTAQFPSNTDFLRMRAEILLSENQLDRAQQLIQDIQKIAPTQYFVRLLQAKYLVKRGEMMQAKAMLSQLVTDAPQDVEVILLYSKVLSALGDSETAVTNLEQYRKKFASTTELKEALSLLYSKQGLYDIALKEVEALRRDNINAPKYIEGKINLLLKLNDYDAAKQEVARLQQLLPLTAENVLVISRFKTRVNDQDGALALLDKFIEGSGATDRLLIEKASLQLKLEQPNAAKDTLAPFLQESGTHPAAFFLAAKADQSLGDWESAYSHFDSGFDASGGATIYAQGMFESAINTDKPERFADKLVSFMSTRSDSPPVLHYLLAEFYLTANQPESAKKQFEQYLSFDAIPNRDLALIRLAQLELPEQPQRAHELAAKAFAIAPNNAEILATYGWTFAVLDDYQSALYHLRESQAMASNNSETLYKLGFVLAKLGKTEEALIHLNRAQELKTPRLFASKAQKFAQEIKK